MLFFGDNIQGGGGQAFFLLGPVSKRYLYFRRDVLARACNVHNLAVHWRTAEQRISLALLYSSDSYRNKQ